MDPKGEVYDLEAIERDPDRLKKFFSAIPTDNAYALIFMARYMDTQRKPQPQDFGDTEHGVSSIYSDVFVTDDGYLHDLVTKRSRLNTIRGYRVARGTRGLVALLRQIS